MTAALPILLAALQVAPGPGGQAASRRCVVALVPSADPAITAAIADGARFAFEECRRRGGPALELVVGAGGGAWATVSSRTVDLLSRTGAIALLTPPERRAAHAVALIATRAHVPAISTSPEATVTGTGSYWIRAVLPLPPGGCATPDDPARASAFRVAFQHRFGRPADTWAIAGHDAAAVLAAAVRRAGTEPFALVQAMRTGPPVPGATALIRFDRCGRRLSAAAPAPGRLDSGNAGSHGSGGS